MLFLKYLISAISIVTAYASADESGPPTFSQSTPAPAVSYRPRYVMKDAILYLTPSQIKILEATKGLNKVIPVGNANDNDKHQKPQYSEQELSNLEELIRKQLTQQNIHQSPGWNLLPTQLVEPNTEKPLLFSSGYAQPLISQSLPQLIAPQPISPISLSLPRLGENYLLPLGSAKPALTVPESYSYIKMFTDKTVHEVPRIPLFHPVLHQQKISDPLFHPLLQKISDPLLHQNLVIQDPIYNKRYKLVPYSYETDNLRLYEQQWPNLDHLKDVQNTEVSKNIKTGDKKIVEQSLDFPKYLSALKYAPQYVSHKIATEFQKLLAQIQKDKADKKSHSVAHQSGSLKQQKQDSLINQVSVNYFEPVPIEYNIPQTYLSLDNVHSVPTSSEKAEKAEIEKAEAFEIEKQLDVPVSRNLFVIKDKPFVADQYLPAENKEASSESLQKPEKISLYRHLFNSN